MDSRAIGVFDSGVGGLTVVAQLQEVLPYEDIVYLGDTARVPYGTKSAETIIKFSLENAAFLIKQNVKCIVVACNSASAYAISDLKTKYPKLPIIGMIESGASYLVGHHFQRVAIIGTTATIRSKEYPKLIHKLNPKIDVLEEACPLFVPLVEEGLLIGKITENIVEHYLGRFKEERLDAVLLGCTHYPLLRNEISAVLSQVTLIDSGQAATEFVQSELKRLNILNSKHLPFLRCYLTSPTETFARIARSCLTKEMNELFHVDLDSISYHS